MNNRAIWWVIAVIVIIAIIWYIAAQNNDPELIDGNGFGTTTPTSTQDLPPADTSTSTEVPFGGS